MIFLLGQIRHRSVEASRADYKRAQRMLEAQGYVVTNIFNDKRYQFMGDVAQHLKNFEHINTSKAVFVMKGYEKDELTEVELHHAKIINKRIIYEIPSSDDVMKAVSSAVECSPEEIQSTSRRQLLVYAREAYAFIRHRDGLRDCNINNEINRKHPTTAYLKKTHETDIKYNKEYQDIVNKVLEFYNKSQQTDLFTINERRYL